MARRCFQKYRFRRRNQATLSLSCTYHSAFVVLTRSQRRQRQSRR